MRRFFSVGPLLALAALTAGLLAPVATGQKLVHPSYRLTAANCSQPVGTDFQPGDPEPTVPIWCTTTPSAPQQTGSSDGFGGWIDKFENTISGNQPAHLSDGEIGYHVYNVAPGTTSQAQHWEANGYFMADLARLGGEQGTDLSPMQSFTFQNRKLVIEGDVAAATPGFSDPNGADEVWPEIDFSTSPTPNESQTNDGLYLYGYFKGAWASGCRLQAKRSETCAVQADHDLASTTGDQPPCWSAPPARVMELSGFQYCGQHSGFDVAFGSPQNAWRQCPSGTVDPCLDRFRIEWTQSSITLYVNGILFGQDTNWPAASQLPESVVNGSTPIYAHFGEFGDFSSSSVYRFHWGRIAVNPHNADGTPAGPSATCQFLGNCGGGPTPTPSGTPTPTPTPTSTPTPTPSASPTPTPAPTPFACNLRYGGVGHAGHCLQQADGSIRFTTP